MSIISSFKTLNIKILILIISTLYSYEANAQFYGSEQNPPGIKWMQINTPNFQILYPAILEKEALRMSNTLEHLIRSVSESMGKQPRKITIILQNQAVISNGFVQLAPRRSEFFTTPPQNFDMQDWLNSLAVHELRHVAQFDKLTGNLKAPLFEELALAIFGITLPPWFFEGDAVGIETALSHAGRGRLPDWEIIFRTNTLSGKDYSYSKNYFGSFKDLTPGYYQLGYFMTSKLKRDYGKGIMDSLMTSMSRKPFRPYNLSRSMKKFTGLNSRLLHDSTTAELQRLWKDQESASITQQYPAINKRLKAVPADYLLPARMNTGEILVLRKGLDRTPELIKLDSTGKEHLVMKIGFQTESNFNYSNGRVVWDEFRYDKRYQKRSYNVINIFDLTNTTYKQLTHKSRLFAPVLSPDGKNIAAVRIDLANRAEIVEIDPESGSELRVFPNHDNYILQTPSYSNDGTRIICVAVSKAGAALIEINRLDSSHKVILDFQWQQLSRPVYAGETILFRAHFNGINNIYSIRPGTGALQLTSASYGASNPSYDKVNNAILFNIFQTKGDDIASIPLNNNPGLSVSEIKNLFIDYAKPLVLQESDSTVLDNVPRENYPIKPYTEFRNLFYFHSLAAIVEDNEFNSDMNIGLKVKSNNQLNTLSFYTGYQFNSGLRKSEYLAGFTYKRFYPLLDVRYINRARLANVSQTQGGTTTFIPVNWREDFLEMEIRIPFVANRLNKTYSMGVSGLTSYTSRYQISNRPARFTDKIRFPLQYQLYFSHNTQRSLRDLAPRWGQNVSLSYQSLPFDNNLSGDILRLQTSFFVPGLLTNHSLQASFNYQNAGGIYRFNVDIPRVSGYASLKSRPVRNTLLLDYRLPLLYPDAEISTLAYIKRIRGGLFADFQNIGKGNQFTPATYGLELNADMNLLRFYLPDFALSGKLIFLNERRFRSPVFELGFNYNL
ncbi:TolB family protein [Daejeonella sp.]|uniref:TolB family protein n=1 Tax=Daejeonella sp. TaxID=2805397 RepID=UPI003982ED7B